MIFFIHFKYKIARKHVRYLNTYMRMVIDYIGFAICCWLTATAPDDYWL